MSKQILKPSELHACTWSLNWHIILVYVSTHSLACQSLKYTSDSCAHALVGFPCWGQQSGSALSGQNQDGPPQPFPGTCLYPGLFLQEKLVCLVSIKLELTVRFLYGPMPLLNSAMEAVQACRVICACVRGLFEVGNAKYRSEIL